ncbi:MAG TPA: potassium channel family protein [Rhodopila sp.]|uniref:potassium channel family protein n=1 Tax=Rhodopila sp. TaxID=2480087 RepID=UPI002BDDD1FC|nr:potassium channel family protein [Rhodopila sp.]HVY16250.1 potassium channel family protein [Rhodopila sp.]
MPVPTDAQPVRAHGRERLREWTLTGLLVFEVLLLFVGVPIGATFKAQWPMTTGAILALVMVSTVVIMSRSTGAWIVATVAVLLAGAGLFLRVTEPSAITVWLGHLAAIASVFALSIVIARVVFGPGRVTTHRIQGAIVLYLNVAVTFTSAYRLVLELNPTAFAGVPLGLPETAAFENMLYFSFTTLTSTGYGELLPISPAARSLANLEAITGQLYLAILLARLVTLHVESRSR